MRKRPQPSSKLENMVHTRPWMEGRGLDDDLRLAHDVRVPRIAAPVDAGVAAHAAAFLVDVAFLAAAAFLADVVFLATRRLIGL
jgi:hypothetical protein